MNNDQFGVSARIKEFHQRQGSNAARLGEWWFYSNGAAREVDVQGALLDPPADQYSRLANILNYHRARRQKVVREFDALHQRLLMLAEPDGEGLSRLKELQSVIGQLNADVQQAEQALANTPEGKRREHARRTAAEDQEKRAAFRNELKAVRI